MIKRGRNPRTGKLICNVVFNDTQFGADSCTRDAGHAGDHFDSISKHWGHNNEPARSTR